MIRFFVKLMVFLPLIMIFPHYVNAAISNHEFKGGHELRVGLIRDGRKPYFWVDKLGETRGVYITLLERISSQIKSNLSYQHLPQARIRLYMKHGHLDIEPGIAESWRSEPLELESSVYSMPFLTTDEVFIYNQKHKLSKLPTTEELYLLKRCSLAGLNHSSTATHNKDKEVRNETKLLEMLENQRCDYLLMPKLVFDFWAIGQTHHLAATDTIITYQLRLRINKHKEYLLPEINSVITDMLKKGEIRKLIEDTFSLRIEESNHEEE